MWQTFGGERRSDTSTARAEVGHIDREATRSTNGIAKVIPRSTTDKAIEEESSQVTLGERGSDTSTARSTNGIAKVIPRSTTNKAIQDESSQVTFHSGSSLNCSTAGTNTGWKQSTAESELDSLFYHSSNCCNVHVTATDRTTP